MKKYIGMITFVLALFGCDEANEINEFTDDYDEYYWTDGSGVNHNLVWDGPVVVNASSWGSVVYVADAYVNKDITFLISENESAEGGMEIPVTSNTLTLSGLTSNLKYYYCLISSTFGKSEIKNMVVPEASSLSMSIEDDGDYIICTVEEEILDTLIVEKGFRWWGDSSKEGDCKYIVSDRMAESSDGDKSFKVAKAELPQCQRMYAYIQTENGYFKTQEIYLSSDEENVSVSFSEITEGEEYLECTVTGGRQENVYFYVYSDGEHKYLQPTSVDSCDDGSYIVSLKKGYYHSASVRYGYWYEDDNWFTTGAESEEYTIKQYPIYSINDLVMATSVLDAYYWDNDSYGYRELVLQNDIRISSDERVSIALGNFILNGGEKRYKIDGFAFYPLFRNGGTVKNLIIGSDTTEFYVDKGKSGLSTTNTDTPRYFLSNSDDLLFENCELRGSIKVYNQSSFYISPAYYYYYLWGNDTETGTEDHLEVVTGLKDYTTIEYLNN